MPLSVPVSRRLYHNRVIRCIGYRREDALWDIEGHLIDTKSYSFPSDHRGGKILPGEPLHDMWLRLTVDDNLLIHGLEAVIDSSPFDICPTITERFQLLKGMTIGQGWNRQMHELLGGTKGCTHLVELLRPVATTAIQTIFTATRDKPRPVAQSIQDTVRPDILESCHALATDSSVVQTHWPQFYSGK
jgi:hypothetical protein